MDFRQLESFLVVGLRPTPHFVSVCRTAAEVQMRETTETTVGAVRSVGRTRTTAVADLVAMLPSAGSPLSDLPSQQPLGIGPADYARRTSTTSPRPDRAPTPATTATTTDASSTRCRTKTAAGALSRFHLYNRVIEKDGFLVWIK